MDVGVVLFHCGLNISAVFVKTRIKSFLSKWRKRKCSAGNALALFSRGDEAEEKIISVMLLLCVCHRFREIQAEKSPLLAVFTSDSGAKTTAGLRAQQRGWSLTTGTKGRGRCCTS